MLPARGSAAWLKGHRLGNRQGYETGFLTSYRELVFPPACTPNINPLIVFCFVLFFALFTLDFCYSHGGTVVELQSLAILVHDQSLVQLLYT